MSNGQRSFIRELLDRWLRINGYDDIGELKQTGWALLSFVQYLEQFDLSDRDEREASE